MIVEGPDGLQIEFPDGTDDATINKVMTQAHTENQNRRQLAGMTPDVPLVKPNAATDYAALPWYQKAGQAADDTVRLLANGMTLGYGDKFAAKMNELTGLDAKRTGDLITGSSPLDRERQKTADARTRAGSAGTVDEILGSLLPAGALAKSSLSATKYLPTAAEGIKGLLMRALAGGVDGATLGTVNAAGNDQDLKEGAALGGLAGIGGSVIGDAVSAGASKVAGLFNKTPPRMSPQQLKQAATKAYQDADNAGVIFKPEAVKGLRDKVYNDYAEFGYHPDNQPGAATAFKELDRLSQGGNVSLKGMDTLRKVAGGGFKADNPSNNKLLGAFQDSIDDFTSKAGPNDILAGDPQAGADALSQGRNLWQRATKMERVQELLDNAGLRAGSTGSGGNIENATRQELKKALTSPKYSRGMTADERQAIRDAVLGTKSQNALRLAGKLSPQGNGLMLAIGGAATAKNPMLGIPAMAAGYGAKKASEAMTRSNVKALQDLIAAGGSKAALVGPKNAVQRLAESKRDAIARLLMMSGIIAPNGR